VILTELLLFGYIEINFGCMNTKIGLICGSDSNDLRFSFQISRLEMPNKISVMGFWFNAEAKSVWQL
jgi:hypothetical protein